MADPAILARPSELERAPVARGLAAGDRIDREGGDNGAGIIRGLAVITNTEALGHGFWVDQRMLHDVQESINAAGHQGIKARFTHPGLSGDGLGSFLGRMKNARVDGDIVRADLHFSQSAHNTPDGDLAAYTMDLAESDPDAFGTSIVFSHDRKAEQEFLDAYDVDGEFESPDVKNVNNLPHARLAALQAVDVVDEPAANPDGLFHRQAEIGEEADALAAYALGLSDQKPTLSALSIDADRVSAHLSRFLDRNGLQVVPRKEVISVSDSNTATPSRDEYSEQLSAYTARFGAEKGVELFLANTPMHEALDAHNRQLTADLAAARTELETATESLAAKDAEISTLKAEVESLKKRGGQQARVEWQSSDSNGSTDDDSLSADDEDSDALATKLWKSNPDLRAEFTDEGAFRAYYAREPHEFADLLN